jgi:pSer/pThr/pTyr-binding forkhead associated (FHA) protein
VWKGAIFVLKVFIELISDSDAQRKMCIVPGRTVFVGRSSAADFVVSHDRQMSSEHFLVECSISGAQLRDLKSATGTKVNDERVDVATLHHGDMITAGNTRFAVSIERDSVEEDPESDSDVRLSEVLEVSCDQVFAFLSNLERPLYAILDAARDQMVLALLAQFDNQYQSLYEGAQGDQLAEAAPYLVHLPPEAPLLAKLVELGWGNSWGIFFTSDKDFKEVRKHFRRFLIVKAPTGEELYFRFYDPRVFGQVFVIFDQSQVREFSQVISCFYRENQEKKLIVYSISPGKLSAK